MAADNQHAKHAQEQKKHMHLLLRTEIRQLSPSLKYDAAQRAALKWSLTNICDPLGALPPNAAAQ